MSAFAMTRTILYLSLADVTFATTIRSTTVQVATIPCPPRQGEVKILGVPPDNNSLQDSATLPCTDL